MIDFQSLEAQTRQAMSHEVRLCLHCGQWLAMQGDLRAAGLFAQVKDLDINHHRYWVDEFKLGPHSTVIDVGGYIGDSVVAWVRAGCHTIAFEPFLDAYTCLVYNLRDASLNQLEHFNLAVGNGERVRFNYDYEKDDCGCRYLETYEAGFPTVRLDDLPVNRVDFLKIDCEGREPLVLRGAMNLIRRDRPIIVVEAYPEGLRRQGFTVDHLRQIMRELNYRIVNDEASSRALDFICRPGYD